MVCRKIATNIIGLKGSRVQSPESAVHSLVVASRSRTPDLGPLIVAKDKHAYAQKAICLLYYACVAIWKFGHGSDRARFIFTIRCEE